MYKVMLSFFRKLVKQFFHFRTKYFTSQINHGSVIALINQHNASSPRYIFLVIISLTIATLGLLINSPTFLLGAMLIFPLMGIITSLGFTLCTLNYDQLKYNLKFIFIGIIFAVGTSYFIVKISPLDESTDLIISKTHPNLFDLLVAVSSGLACGYTHIKSKGQEVIAVAIATSLSPPLAVIGYGLATDNYQFATGASYLFITNLLAITLSVAGIAKWYGFGIRNNQSFILWQASITLIVFITLSIPLAITLHKIATEALLKQKVENIFRNTIGYSSKLNEIKVFLPNNPEKPVMIKAIILVDDKNSKDLSTKLKQQITSKLNINSVIEINKVYTNTLKAYTYKSHLQPVQN